MNNLGTGAGQLNLTFQIGAGREITFDFGTTDISGWTFEFLVKQKGARTKSISFTLGSGLTLPAYSNELLATFTSVNTGLQEGRYYWELRRTDTNRALIAGNCYFNYDAQQGDGSSLVNVAFTTYVIEVTVENSGGSSSGLSTVTTDNATITGDGSTLLPIKLKPNYIPGLNAGGTIDGTELFHGSQVNADVYLSIENSIKWGINQPPQDINGDYIFLATDAQPRTLMNAAVSASSSNLTVNANTFPAGCYLYILRRGAGLPTFVAGAGMTINSATGIFTMGSQKTISGIYFYSATECYLLNGISGGGDFVGPASAVSGNVVVFSGTTGKLGADGGGPLPVKATATELNTGTDDAKFATTLGLENSKYLTQSGAKISATAAGTDTYTATISPAITAYASGQRFFILFTNGNTGAATLNLNSLGAKSIKKNTGTALASGDIPAGYIGLVAYDGTNFQLLNPSITVGASSKIWNITVSSNQQTFVQNTVRWFGIPQSTQAATSEGIRKIPIPVTGTITICTVGFYSSTVTPGTNESFSLVLRLNATTDFTIATIAAATADRIFTNLALSIAVTAGDSIEFKWVFPATWGTAPSATTTAGSFGISY